MPFHLPAFPFLGGLGALGASLAFYEFLLRLPSKCDVHFSDFLFANPGKVEDGSSHSIMAQGLIARIKTKILGETPLRPIERKMARHWVKTRLARIFPELREDPKALEKAYRALNILAHEGSGEGGTTLFEMILPEGTELERMPPSRPLPPRGIPAKPTTLAVPPENPDSSADES